MPLIFNMPDYNGSISLSTSYCIVYSNWSYLREYIYSYHARLYAWDEPLSYLPVK